MEQQKLSIWTWLTAAISVFLTFPAYGDVEQANTVQLKKEAANSELPITNIAQLNNIPHPQTSVRDWLAQEAPQNQVIQVTGVRLNPTTSGLDIILETSTSNHLQTTIESKGNTFSAIIPNTQLHLPSGNSFRADHPHDGITVVMIVNQNTNSILVTVNGSTNVPKIELFVSNQGLILPLIPSSSSQQKPPETGNEPPQTKQSNQEQKPIEILVTGEPEDSYKVPTASTGTKFSVPLLDIPLSVQVIPSQVIEDRQIVREDQITDNVSGIQRILGYGNASGYAIRGFSNYGTFINGFRGPEGFTPGDTTNVESIEVLKGPASVLYGSGYNEGGVFNVVTKKPLDTPFYSSSFTAGSYNYYRSSLDFTGPLNTDNSLLYRFNTSYENSGSYRDFINNENFLVAPALTWRIDKKTTFSTEVDYQHSNFIFDSQLPLVPQSLQLPISRSLSEPDASSSELNSTSITYTFDHKFSNNWSFKQGFNTLISEANVGSWVYYLTPLNANNTINRLDLKGTQYGESYTLMNELFGKFDTGSIHHNILIGTELYRRDISTSFAGAFLAPINIFNPVYGAQPGSFSSQLGIITGELGADNIGIYVQDLVDILPQVKLLVGGRFDLIDSFAKDAPGGNLINDQTDSKFSPRAGIVYQPSKSTSVYFNWSNHFDPVYYSGTAGATQTGQPFKPETTEQFEVGVKQEFLNHRLSGTIALYQITRQNVLTPDPTNPLYSVQTGEQTSRGVELDVTGKISPGWNVIGTYTYDDAFVSKDNSIPVGDQLIAVPFNSASIWTTYELQSGHLKGLGFGLGLVYSGSYQVSLPNTFTAPSYLRTDASLFYRQNKYRIGLNFNNLFNIKYYYYQIDALAPAPPFSVVGSVSVEF